MHWSMFPPRSRLPFSEGDRCWGTLDAASETRFLLMQLPTSRAARQQPCCGMRTGVSQVSELYISHERSNSAPSREETGSQSSLPTDRLDNS